MKRSAPERVATPLVSQPAASRIQSRTAGCRSHHRCLELSGPVGIDPFGVGNCSRQLRRSHADIAMAARRIVCKPSEVASASSAVLAKHLSAYLDSEAFVVVVGGRAETTALLEQRFDRIFYTGGGGVGRAVMAAAAKHLTPVTLELGGKNPCGGNSLTRAKPVSRQTMF